LSLSHRAFRLIVSRYRNGGGDEKDAHGRVGSGVAAIERREQRFERGGGMLYQVRDDSRSDCGAFRIGERERQTPEYEQSQQKGGCPSEQIASVAPIRLRAAAGRDAQAQSGVGRRPGDALCPTRIGQGLSRLAGGRSF
jgi:hypothetical protein